MIHTLTGDNRYINYKKDPLDLYNKYQDFDCDSILLNMSYDIYLETCYNLGVCGKGTMDSKQFFNNVSVLTYHKNIANKYLRIFKMKKLQHNIYDNTKSTSTSLILNLTNKISL